MGEGSGVIVLETLEHALARGATIRGELVGYAATADAHHITAPSGEGARRAMTLAIADAGLKPADVRYVNAHGTSTPVGDVQEIEAMKQALGAAIEQVAISSSKSMHGHLLGAAGAVEAIVTLRAIETGIVPPTINLHRPSPGCDVNLVANEAQRRDVRVAMSNSFGFGGTNASLVLARYEG
jgi:3-oxoacyl-[acyl-carrier-protein] synthase II